MHAAPPAAGLSQSAYRRISKLRGEGLVLELLRDIFCPDLKPAGASAPTD